MTTTTTNTAGLLGTALYSLKLKLITAIALIALADFLFFKQTPGLSIAVFAAALCLGATTANPAKISFNRLPAALPLLIAGLLPVINTVNLLSISLAATSSAFFVLWITGAPRSALLQYHIIAAYFASGFWGLGRFLHDMSITSWLMRKINTRIQSPGFIRVWLAPALFGLIFQVLLIRANPVIENWLLQTPSLLTLDKSIVLRLFFWFAALVIIWPFMHIRLPKKGQLQLPETAAEQDANANSQSYFNTHSVLRALILFNFMFAVQTMLDITYLWNGVSLPKGMNYADYAHRGAYPLIATALLAALFVLLSFRPGADTNKSGLIKRLVYLWIAQNILLVISSMLRLDLYIGAYQLTWLRVCAFIWMGLVATGLVLIITRIIMQLSNAWLIKWNLITLLTTLYICSFINFSQMIANHNINNAQQSGLDYKYLCSLGKDALPAIDTFMSKFKQPVIAERTARLGQNSLQECRDKLVAIHKQTMANWRGWSYRDYQISLYLKTRAQTETASSFEP